MIFACATVAAQEPQRFDIPAQELAGALERYALVANQQILYSDAVGAKAHSQALSGQYTSSEALERLLEGTPFTVQRLSPGVLRVQRNSEAPSLTKIAASSAAAQGAGVSTPPPASLSAATSASAQADAGGSGQLQEIVVTATASRVEREGFSAPTPTTVIGVEQLHARAAVNVADVINELPAFRPTHTPQMAPAGGEFGANNLDLRGLNIPGTGGPASPRTLVLVNGRRHVAQDMSGQVDINMIPSSLVERIEVVTGGASASWGSDAVAGVVNMILKKRLQGVQTNISYGASDKGDGDSYNGSLGAGTAIADGRGHLMIGGEYDKSDGLPFAQNARDWSAASWGVMTLFPMPFRPPGQEGLPANIILPNVGFTGTSAGGYIAAFPFANNGPLGGLTFLPGGGTTPLPVGSVTSFPLTNDGAGIPPGSDMHLINPLERKSLFARAEFDITSRINAYVELSAAETSQKARTAGHLGLQSTQTIQIDNAFLPAAVEAQMAAAGLTSFTLNRYDTEIGRYKQHNERTTRRGVFGLDGDLGGGWTWDAYYQYGYNRSYSQIFDQITEANYASAIDSVVGPNGTIVCRAQLPGSTPGCVPYNPFGVGAPSAAALAYVGQDPWNVTYNHEQVVAANINGEPFSIWAGPVSLAGGVEWRKETAKVTSDPYSNAQQFEFGNQVPVPSIPVAYNFNGQQFTPPGSPYYQEIPGDVGYNVKEFYAETVVPLAKDSGFIHSLDLNAAARRTDYSLSGAVTTWKLGATFEDSSRQFRLRATQSRDIRAPNLSETFGTASSSIGFVADTVQGTGVGVVQVLTSGNPNLEPEVADTYTFGGSISPQFIPGLRVSADYFNIDIAGVIGSLPPQSLVDRCAAGAAEFCSLITRNAAGRMTAIQSDWLNLNRLQTSGIDFEADYRVPLDKLNVPGDFNIRGLVTYTEHLTTTDTAGPVDRAGQAMPKMVYSLAFNYGLGRFSTNLTARILGEAIIDVTKVGPEDPGYSPSLPNSISSNRNPAVLYLNLGAQYTTVDKGDSKLVLYGVINNLTDEEPPGYAGTIISNNYLYDVMGRFIRVGLRFNY